MRTNIVLDDALVKEAFKYSENIKIKKENNQKQAYLSTLPFSDLKNGKDSFERAADILILLSYLFIFYVLRLIVML
ncbi:MAG: type II toxin-antitoxin system VapB family antitoxin [Spirochaetaceae bacterium]|jgi:lipopolysaccharide/colanic/teichoic acid biosynthesis glycosyltransferase|nr:type II toxin-antitoxin system VapB family antitoxin [Spirochaetaceae bacterium]